MSIKVAIQSSLSSPRPSFGAGSGSGNAVADTLNDMLDGVAEIERHVKQNDPTNVSLFAKLSQLKADMQAAAQSAEAGRARLSSTLRGPSGGSTGPSKVGPF